MRLPAAASPDADGPLEPVATEDAEAISEEPIVVAASDMKSRAVGFMASGRVVSSTVGQSDVNASGMGRGIRMGRGRRRKGVSNWIFVGIIGK